MHLICTILEKNSDDTNQSEASLKRAKVEESNEPNESFSTGSLLKRAKVEKSTEPNESVITESLLKRVKVEKSTEPNESVITESSLKRVKVEKSTEPNESVFMETSSAKFHSHFLRKLSQNKMWNVNCNRILLTGPKMVVYWSDYITKINDKFPNIIQACHINKVSFDEVSIKYNDNTFHEKLLARIRIVETSHNLAFMCTYIQCSYHVCMH